MLDYYFAFPREDLLKVMPLGFSERCHGCHRFFLTPERRTDHAQFTATWKRDDRLCSEGVMDSQQYCLAFSVVKALEIATVKEMPLEKVKCIKEDPQCGMPI